MKKTLLLALLGCQLIAADNGKPPRLRAWWGSVGMLAAATAADIYSSRGGYELNPILGRGQFGARQAGIKIGAVVGLATVQRLVLRRHPRAERSFVVANVASGAATGLVAYRNTGQR